MFRIMATVVASSAVLLAPSHPATAPADQNTAIVGFASSVSGVSYQQPVTFTGQLVEGFPQTPVPDEPVQIEIWPAGTNGYVPVATATTGSDGHFTVTTSLPSGGQVQAFFAGDTGLRPGQSAIFLLGVNHLRSRLVLDRVPGSVKAGTRVTFSGTLQVRVNGTWQPFQGSMLLTLTMEPYTSSLPTVQYVTPNGPQGHLRLTEIVSVTGLWAVDTSQTGLYSNDWFPDWTTASYGLINGVSRTRFSAFSLPAKAEAHHAEAKGLNATGTVERWNGSSWVRFGLGSVQVYYRPKGSATWHKLYGPVEAGVTGKFEVNVGAHLGTTDWQVRVVKAADTLPSTSATLTSTVTDATHFASSSIERTSSGTYIFGQVSDLRDGQSFSSLRGLKVRLYYRADGTKTWHAYKTGKVRTQGGITGLILFIVTKNHGYHFKIVLPAQGPFLSCTSRVL